jgi:tetratricopeptide (TPR) repeat protein
VEGNYNLANLLEGQGELDAAVLFYKKAIQAEPEFADAHFNLAMVLEGLGNRARAREHWRRYLELDPESKWVEFIKRRLEEP